MHGHTNVNAHIIFPTSVIIQNLHEWNNSKMEPDWHKRYYFTTHNENKHSSFADNHVIIADSKDNLQIEYLHYKT